MIAIIAVVIYLSRA